MLVLIKNDNIKVAAGELCRRNERMGACITTLRGQGADNEGKSQRRPRRKRKREDCRSGRRR